jgi:hypothetical protein
LADAYKLSLKGSFINGVTMRGIQLQAGFDCSDTSAQTKNGPAWIDAHAAKIHGGVTANGAKLQAQARADGKKREDWQDAHYALRLSNALIEGRLDFKNNFTANGGINISGARISGDIWGLKATLTAGEHYAFSAQSAQIGGMVGLDGLKATGCLWMLNITISGTLSMPNARLQKHKKDSKGLALAADNATIGGAVLLRDNFTAKGEVSLSGAKINGTLDCDNGHFANHTANGNGQALNAQSTTISGSVLLRDNFTADGQVSLLNAKINGSLACNTATICNVTATRSAIALNATNAEIGQSVLLPSFTSIGRASFRGCRTGGNFNCTNATFAAWGPGERCYALDGQNLTIGQDADLSGTRIIGRLVLEHAQIGGTLTWGKGSDLANPLKFPTFVRAYLPETKDGELQRSGALWGYSGKLNKPEDAKPPANKPDGPQARLILAHAKIGAALQAYRLAAEVPLLIDLSAAQAYTLDDDASQGDHGGGKSSFPAGWGGDAENAPFLDLDGFTYQRIEYFPIHREAPVTRWQKCRARFAKFSRETDIASPRLKWLNRPNKKNNQNSFYPQPYRHLATVLRNQGHSEAARRVAIAEKDAAARTPAALLWKWTFGLCFGYGLSVGRAIIILFVTLFIGWALVFSAHQRNVLVLTPDRIEALATEHTNSFIPGVGEACGPTEIRPVLYAIDMALPIIPLHQEDRCEVGTRPSLWWWQTLWAAYSIIAKIITSLALITFSGVMKPKDE